MNRTCFVMHLLFLVCLLASCVTAEIGVLVIGETGSGKSRLINLLFNKTVTIENAKTTGTFVAQDYNISRNDKMFRVWDTRGFNDVDISDADIMRQIVAQVDSVHLVLICIDLSRSRWTASDEKMLLSLQKHFETRRLGGTPVVVFTKANMVGDMTDVLTERVTHIQGLPYIVVGNTTASVQRIWELNVSVPFNFTDIRRACSNPAIIRMMKGCDYPVALSNISETIYQQCLSSAKVAGSMLGAGVGLILGAFTGGLAPVVMALSATGGVAGMGVASDTFDQKCERIRDNHMLKYLPSSYQVYTLGSTAVFGQWEAFIINGKLAYKAVGPHNVIVPGVLGLKYIVHFDNGTVAMC